MQRNTVAPPKTQHLAPEELFEERLSMPRMSQQRKASTKFSAERHGFGEEVEEQKKLDEVLEEP